MPYINKIQINLLLTMYSNTKHAHNTTAKGISNKKGLTVQRYNVFPNKIYSFQVGNYYLLQRGYVFICISFSSFAHLFAGLCKND